MNLHITLVIHIAITMKLLTTDIGCVEYAMVERKPKGVGYSHIQEVIELCKRDSTFKKTESLQRRKRNVIETISSKVSTGRWSIDQDTLTTYTIDPAYTAPLEHKYVIKNSQLIPVTIGRSPFGVVPLRFRYKLYTGSKSLIE